MGKVRMGILDGFYGKVGTVVGSFWKGKPVMRAYVRPKGTHTSSEAQALVQTRFAAINSLFGNFPQVTVMGITGEDDAEIPEGVEITVSMFYDTLATLELRVNDLGRFPVIAASIIKALYGETKSWGDVLHIPEERAKRARENPGDSFEEPVDETNGENPRTYYAYYPNEYHDGVNWIQMTLVFPMAGAWDGDRITLGTERSENENMLPEEEANPDYTGYFSTDDYTHLEVFATATPEPDSAAAEYDFR